MTDYEIAHLINRITGLIAAVLAFGLTLGYARVVDSDNALVRAIAWSIICITVASMVECLRVVHTTNVAMHILGILYNLTVMFGVIWGLRAQFWMIPEEDRVRWRWYTAPLYPPWRWLSGLHTFVSNAQRHLWCKSSTTTDRRRQHKPIDFPDRRER